MDPHYVSAERPRIEEPKRVLMHGNTFAVLNNFGDISREGLGDEGLYHDGTRFLSSSYMRIKNVRLLFLSSTMKKDNSVFTVDLTNPDIVTPKGTMARGSLHIRRTCFVWNETLYTEVYFRNYSTTPIEMPVLFHFESDFADVFEVRGTKRAARGVHLPQEIDRSNVALSYKGLDGILRKTVLEMEPIPARIDDREVEFSLGLGPSEEKVFRINISCDLQGTGAEGVSQETARLLIKKAHVDLNARGPIITSSNGQFGEWVSRSLADVEMLSASTPHGHYPYAGVPWFSTPFGRDGILTALECLWFNPELAKGVLGFLSATQATDVSAERDSQPGKILHETRGGEMAALGEIPFGRYYGSVDSTPLFVCLAGAYFDRTHDLPFIQQIWPCLEKAMEWIEKYGDVDGDGFVEYQRASSRGLANQGWKDSEDSVFLDDGSLIEGPVALCEVQAYVYSARCYFSKLAAMVGQNEVSTKQRKLAEDLRQKFEAAFWCEDLGTYALALDGRKQAARVRTSNAGHCLFGGIAGPERGKRVAETLLSDASFSGWGVRTLAEGEKRYNPMSYHNGSVWPHDNAVIAQGLSRYGRRQEALRILEGFFWASTFVDLHRMPELFCGFERRPGSGPTLYPVACSPQAWAAGSVFMMLAAVLGLDITSENTGEVRFHYPVLPEFLEDLKILGLRVGTGRLDLVLRRHRGDVSVDVENRKGDIEVTVIK